MPSSPKRAVIWDMDGVIADTALAHCNSWKFAFKKQGVNFTDEEFHKIFGQRNDLIIRLKLGQSVNPELIDTISADKEMFFRTEIVKDLRPFPGVISLLQTIRENGISMAIGSSAPLENVEVVIHGLKIQNYFSAIVFGLEVKEGKPSPDVFLAAARKLAVEPVDCIVVEDAIAGVQAAKRAGMSCIAVTNSHPAEALKQADMIVSSLQQVHFTDLERIYLKNRPK
jgi:beta-phosphoglucomutase family hydrolase